MTCAFPPGFLWGAATAAHQVEGGLRNNWTRWEESEARVQALEAAGVGREEMRREYVSGVGSPEHGVHWRRDYEVASRELGHTATRFSIEWSRVQPESAGAWDEEAVAHYRAVVAHVVALGMTPFVTLWHWSEPLWFADRGGFGSPKAVAWFAAFASRMAAELAPLGVKFWITLNEPEVNTLMGRVLERWPPGRPGGARRPSPWKLAKWRRWMRLLGEAHREARAAIRAVDPSAQVGIAKHNVIMDASASGNPLARPLSAAAAWLGQRAWNGAIVGAADYESDFVGLNFYFHHTVRWSPLGGVGRRFAGGVRAACRRVAAGLGGKAADPDLGPDGAPPPPDPAPVSDMGWTLSPEGFYRAVHDTARRHPGKPVYVTEHGLADRDDAHRGWYLVQSLRRLHDAIQDGCDVRGYLHWSLLDNFEWDSGYLPAFGLLAVDRASPDRTRTPRPSALVYRDIILANAVPE